jgi:ketosteroid isomerase-like protein
MEIKMEEDVSSTIAALEDERYTAMLSGDTEKLDRLLDDRLRHVHSSGHVDNKTSWMSNFGRLWQYRSIERQDRTIVPLGDTALVFDTLHIDVQVADGLREVHARALTVWTKSGGVWRVVAVFLATIPTAKP